MKKLYEEFFECNPHFEIAGVKVKNLYDGNLEKMLESMGAVAVSNNIKVIDADIESKIEKVQHFIREKIKAGTFGEEVKGIYHEFYMKTVCKGRKTPISVFTTNYDLYNEQALDSLAFPYNNGFIGTYSRLFNPASYKYAYVEDMNLSKDVWERVPNFFNLYKMHGSISWVKRKGQIYETDIDHIDDGDTVMIYPTPLKDRTTLMTPYSDLFRAFETALLRSNSILITLGYSFADDHINRLILNALAIPTFRLVIFGQSDNIDKLIEMNDSRIIVINSEDKIHYFKNFVTRAMPEIQEDMKEKIGVPVVAKIIEAFEGERHE
ncbi:MAG: SIR2 family protein [Eubacteriales bacterium]|nr:SIR2 family protein [Eubacteriales bacterium]